MMRAEQLIRRSSNLKSIRFSLVPSPPPPPPLSSHSPLCCSCSCSCSCNCNCEAASLRSSSPSRHHLLLPLSSRFFSSSSSCCASSSSKKIGGDERLKTVVHSEIQCAQEFNSSEVLPDFSPFEVVDNPGEQMITLKREFAGENIQVEVHMADTDGGEEDSSDAESNNDDEKNSNQPSVSLIVSVSKGEGPYLEFCCTAYPDDITIESMLMKGREEVSANRVAYEGPQFSDLDESLQKAFYQYLEVRGIKSTLTNSLHDYLLNKDNGEYLRWLKNMNDFIEA